MTTTIRRFATIIISLTVMLSFTFIGSDEVFAASYAKVKSLKATGTVYNSTTLTWKKPGSKVKGYRVRVYKYNKTKKKYKLTLTKNLGKSAKKYKVKLSMNNKYKFMVYAKYKSGSKTKYSKAVTKIVTPTIARPAVGLSSKTSTQVKLKISKTTTSAKKATGFTVYKNGKAVGSYKTSKNTSYYTVKGLKANTKYRFNAKPYRVISGKKTYGTISKSYYVTTSKAATTTTKPSTNTTKPSTSTKPNTSTTPSKPVESTSQNSGGNTTPQSDTANSDRVQELYEQLKDLYNRGIEYEEDDWDDTLWNYYLSSNKDEKAAAEMFLKEIGGYSRGGYMLNNTDDRATIAKVMKNDSLRYNSSGWKYGQVDTELLPFTCVKDVSKQKLDEDLAYITTKYPNIAKESTLNKIIYTVMCIDDIYTYDKVTGQYSYKGKNKKLGICDNYATAMQYCLNALEVPCYKINCNSKDHAWNIVKMDGTYYNVDSQPADLSHELLPQELQEPVYEQNVLKLYSLYGVMGSDTLRQKQLGGNNYVNTTSIKCTNTDFDEKDWALQFPNITGIMS